MPVRVSDNPEKFVRNFGQGGPPFPVFASSLALVLRGGLPCQSSQSRRPITRTKNTSDKIPYSRISSNPSRAVSTILRTSPALSHDPVAVPCT